jgi:hypothetical protein
LRSQGEGKLKRYEGNTMTPQLFDFSTPLLFNFSTPEKG